MRQIIIVIIILCFLLVFPAAVYAEPPPKVLDINVPNYVVEKREGWDYVDIPGGNVLLVDGKPRLPYYSFTLLYPQRCRIQKVVLINKSGLVTTSGLNLTIVKSSPLSSEEEEFFEEEDGWYPAKDFRWRIWVNPDGSTFLVIDIFPFHYNTATTEVRFFSHYKFEVTYTFTNLSIAGLSTDKTVYEPGEPVYVNVLLNNSEEPMDVVMGTLIRRYGSDQVVEGLPLRTLHSLAGVASATMVWNTSGFPTGNYYVEVVVNDTEGNWLDRKTYGFRLGRSLINITKFSVDPQHFKVGDMVEIAAEIVNAGSTTLSGTCFFKILEDEKLIETLQYNFSSLDPNESLSFVRTWNTSSAKKGAVYSIVAYVYYEGQTTPPIVILAGTNLSPTARFSYTPTKIGLGENVTFDGSDSIDPDGTIVSFNWNFGDGGEGSGIRTAHTYHRLGYYKVILTVTDNEGASNNTFKIVNVVMMYTLNVSSNIGFALEGSGKYREGEEVTLHAPSSIDMPGILGILGGKYVFKQWVGVLNSTKNNVTLVFKGYNPKLNMQAIYVEDYSRVIFTILIMAVVVIAVTAVVLLSRRKIVGTSVI